MSNIKEILDFWFEGMDDSTTLDKNAMAVKKWFIKDPNLDVQIRDRFEEDLLLAKNKAYNDWEDSMQGRLALILLFDQFSRNIYRDNAKMFETDPLALHLSFVSVSEGRDQELQLLERIFLFMPFMHAEDLAMQQLGIDCYTRLVEDSKSKSPQNTQHFIYNLDYTKRHHAIIQKFSRFPHRNEILGRPSTKKEIEFLKLQGSRF